MTNKYTADPAGLPGNDDYGIYVSNLLLVSLQSILTHYCVTVIV